MTKSNDQYVINFQRLHKRFRKKGRSSPAVTYYAFTQDTALSLVEALDEYIKRTRSFYSMFMSYIKSWMKGCSPPTITY